MRVLQKFQKSSKSSTGDTDFTQAAEIISNSTSDNGECTQDAPEDRTKRSAAEVAKSIIDPGVARIEATNKVMTKWDRGLMCIWVVLCAYAYNLDLSTRSTYQVYAANSFNDHSLQSTVNVARGATSAAAQLLSARMSDIFGRMEIIITAVVFYVVGTAIEAASTDIATFTGGSVLWSVGRTMLQLAMEVIVADISTLRWRLLFALVPTWPTLVNTWVSGNIVNAVLSATTWNWGVGMWCVIVPVMSIPVVTHLFIVQRRARRMGRIKSYREYYSAFVGGSFMADLFWILDLVGIFFMLCALCMLLIPLTLAGGNKKDWSTARILAPLCIGCFFIPVFCIWEYYYAPHPLVPVRKLKGRGVWPGLIIGFCLDLSYSMQADYLLSVLMVAFNFSQTMATRITSLFLFCNFSLSTILSFLIYYVRRLKFAMVLGTAIYVAAFGLLIHFRGSPSGKGGIIGGEIMMGFGGSGITYPTQSMMQAWLPHELVATITGLNWAIFQMGTSVGGSVSGAIWTQVLPGELDRRLSPELSKFAYSEPLTYIKKYPFGTPERDAIMEAYQHVQWLLCIAGVCMAVPMFLSALVFRRAILTTGHSLVNSDLKIRDSEDIDSLHYDDSRRGSISNKGDGKEYSKDEDVEAYMAGGSLPVEDYVSSRAKDSKWWKFLDFML